MTSTFTTNKTLELPANGDYVNTWNIPVNSDMTVIDTALGGTTNLNATSGSATLTYTQYRPLILSVTGAVSANVTYTIPSGVGGQWIVRNAMTDSSGGPWDLIFASGGGGTSVIVSRGFTTTIYSDGTNISYSDSRLSTAAGSNRQIQYNNNGVLGASSTFVYDASGNVGIGTASPNSTLHVYANGAPQAAINVQAGASASSAPGIYLTDSRTGASGHQYSLSSGGYISSFYLTDVTASNAVRLLVDGTGNVGIGTASPGAKLDVTGSIWSRPGNAAGALAIFSADATSGTNGISITASFVTGGYGPIKFLTTGTEAMRLDSDGNLLVGATAGFSDKISGFNATNSGWCVSGNNSTTTGFKYGIISRFTAAAPNDANSFFYFGNDNAATRFYVLANGGIGNYSANNVNLSDQRMKKDIQLAGSYLDKICAIPVKTFLYNDQTDEELNLGVIAQDVDAVAPELIDHSGWKDKDGEATDYLSIYQTDLQYALMKCIQELSAKNDALEARLAKLENAQ